MRHEFHHNHPNPVCPSEIFPTEEGENRGMGHDSHALDFPCEPLLIAIFDVDKFEGDRTIHKVMTKKNFSISVAVQQTHPSVLTGVDFGDSSCPHIQNPMQKEYLELIWTEIFYN
jgi:hypothetical protein